jgi:hypothetical protein|eukprot:COSAG01_NODE_281_length_19504_cov_129.173124_9_plen_64_part_00
MKLSQALLVVMLVITLQGGYTLLLVLVLDIGGRQTPSHNPAIISSVSCWRAVLVTLLWPPVSR